MGILPVLSLPQFAFSLCQSVQGILIARGLSSPQSRIIREVQSPSPKLLLCWINSNAPSNGDLCCLAA